MKLSQFFNVVWLSLVWLQPLAEAQSSPDIYQTRFSGVTWDNAQWRLTTTELDQGHYQARMSLANGYHGINVAALGPFFEVDQPVDGDNVNGWPLTAQRQTFATIGGFWDSQPTTNGSNFPWLYQYGGDSVISGIPHWGGIIVDLGGNAVLDASTTRSQLSNFTSMLDMKQGLMNWAFTWKPHQGQSFVIAYQLFAHRLYANQGLVSMNITSSANSNATIVNVLNGDCAVRTNFVHKGVQDKMIYSAVSPHGVQNVSAYIYAGMSVSGAQVISTSFDRLDRPYVGNNESSMAQHSKIAMTAGQIATVNKFVGLASSDAFPDPAAVAHSAASAAMKKGYATSLQAHIGEWGVTFPLESVDDYTYPENGSLPNDPYIIESAITAVTNPFQLLQQTLTSNAVAAANGAPLNHHSISVCGLGSDSYAGQVFWDAEIWMQPGLVAAFPFAGRGIASYRASLYDQAKENIKTARYSSMNKTHFSSNAAIFPWTSARYGNCTATGPCWDYEYHINGDIALEMSNYWVSSGDTDYFESTLFPIYDSIATLYSEILVKNGSNYVLKNMTDPDEYANNVDNGGYTMPLIATTLQNANMFRSMFGRTVNSTWNTQAQTVLVGRDTGADITLEYSSMNGSIDPKQADVVLITYPLDWSGQGYTRQDSLSDLNYYAGKQSPNGPGMTYAIFSIIANEVSPSGCSAYTYQQYSENPYVRAPWFQFSEQLVDDYTTNGGTHPAYPFLTGHGGANQVALFGYLGLRYVPDFNLHIDPALPPQIPQLRYRMFHWHGWPITATSNQTHTTLSLATNSTIQGAVRNTTFASTGIPIIVGSGSTATRYTLSPSGALTIPNRRNAFNKTIPNNALQCQPLVSSSPKFVPGQFPIAAVDGASSTKWQPSSAGTNASITVTLEPGLKVRSLLFDWAQAPPYNFSVAFHNDSSSSSTGGILVAAQKVHISSPYQASRADVIAPVSANTTNVTLDNKGIFTSRYATLSIFGTLANGPEMKKVVNASAPGATVAEWAVVVDGSTAKAGKVERRDEVMARWMRPSMRNSRDERR